MHVLMVGVDSNRVGGMWSVAENYLSDADFCCKTSLRYIPTSTGGSAGRRIFCMLKGFARIHTLLCSQKIDIVHIHMAERGSVFRKGYVIKMAKQHHAAVIIHIHAGPFLKWYGTLYSPLKKLVRHILSSADKVLVLGEYWKKELSSIIPASKIEVLYNGIHIPESNPYDAESQHIVYLGLLKRTKGIYDLLKAVKLLDSKLPESVKVLLCGADAEGDIPDRVSALHLEKRVQLLGWIDAQKRNKILREAAVSVLPSYFEGLSMTVLESMAYGVPVITTNISTMKELLGPSIPLIEPGDANALAQQIQDCLEHPQKRLYYSALEYSRAKEQFSIEEMHRKTLSIYRSLLPVSASES